MGKSASLSFLIEMTGHIRLRRDSPESLLWLLSCRGEERLYKKRNQEQTPERKCKELTRVLLSSLFDKNRGKESENKKLCFVRCRKGAPSPRGAGLISRVRSRLPSFSPTLLCLLFLFLRRFKGIDKRKNPCAVLDLVFSQSAREEDTVGGKLDKSAPLSLFLLRRLGT